MAAWALVSPLKLGHILEMLYDIVQLQEDSRSGSSNSMVSQQGKEAFDMRNTSRCHF